ncbi:histidine--tRNA ligase [Candidatus Marsarchaeota archaeon]|nr:histidine--tRNA ligase [Candidatus Marsarchaeota archaeon]
MIAMPDIPFPRGMRDLLPNAALFRNEMLAKIESVFKRFGFLAIDTPVLETLSILKAKGSIGDEAKLLFETTEDNLGLRYDLTVSLGRYVAMHGDLSMPFKRYAIGKAWRREEPQRLRYREFTQADVDIVGGDEVPANAEAIGTAATALDEIGVDYVVRINSRVLMNSLLGKFGVANEKCADVLRIVDKLDKLGEDKVAGMLQEIGLGGSVVSKIADLINTSTANEEKIALAKKLGADGIAELEDTVRLLGAYGIKGKVSIDFSIVRGLDYYTGIVFEFSDASGKEKSSLGGGGRYDNLVGLYGNKQMPATGASLGIDRILELMNFTKSEQCTYARLFVINVNRGNYDYAVGLANWFRSMGVATDINLASRNISNQLSYANSLKFAYAVIVGDAEQSQGKLKLRNLVSGEERIVSREEALSEIKK